MKISAKARYGLAAMISIAKNQHCREYITLVSISEKLGISKIYLEQVFVLLKQAGFVTSIKGAQGGYQLSKPSESITAFEVLSAIEFSLFQKTESTVISNAPSIETAMQTTIFDALDAATKATLENISLQHLVSIAEKYNSEDEYMFFI